MSFDQHLGFGQVPRGTSGFAIPPVRHGFDIADRLRSLGLNVVDKRPSRGCLWVVGGYELQPLLSSLRAEDYTFRHTPRGGRATGYQPAWYSSARVAPRVMDTPVSELRLSTRARKILYRNGLFTIGAILQFGDLHRLRGMGNGCVHEIMAALHECGVHLNEQDPKISDGTTTWQAIAQATEDTKHRLDRLEAQLAELQVRLASTMTWFPGVPHRN